MDLEIAALCQAAVDHGGLLNIIGTFDTIHATKFPHVIPHCALALRVRFSRIEQGAHKLKVNFVDEDGKPLIPPLQADLQVQVADAADSSAANLVLNINNLKIENPGRYSIDVAIDGRQERSLPLRIVKKD